MDADTPPSCGKDPADDTGGTGAESATATSPTKSVSSSPQQTRKSNLNYIVSREKSALRMMMNESREEGVKTEEKTAMTPAQSASEDTSAEDKEADPPQKNDEENDETGECKEDKEPQVSEQEQHQKRVNDTRYYWSLLDLAYYLYLQHRHDECRELILDTLPKQWVPLACRCELLQQLAVIEPLDQAMACLDKVDEICRMIEQVTPDDHQVLITLRIKTMKLRPTSSSIVRAASAFERLSPALYASFGVLHALLTCPLAGAADRSPDSCNNHPAAARALNVSAAGTLTAHAARRGIFTLYISTDYVFSGAPGEAPYAPLARTNPPNTYGLTKWEGEGAVLAASSAAAGKSGDRPLAAVLRVPILYGKAGKPSDSAVNVLVEQIRKSTTLAPGEPPIKMDDYAQRYPTNTADVARVCVDVCALYTGRSAPGPDAPARLPEVLHFSSEDCKTKLDMCKVLAGIMGVGLDRLEAFRPSDEELRAEERGERVRRPYDCHLDTKETRALGIDCGCVDFAEWWTTELAKE
ncbi:hypothetical protein SLS56_001477 [Neofusicoccum ribis]|uniref:RmlD-like substrate binding domain-containing protein n=1 Tax=Neofusicoccum ribis TaxID=45134 RepID=A0ABR3T8T6_9PEZI